VNVEKRGIVIHLSDEYLVTMSGFPRKGTYVEHPVTADQRAAYKRAKRALKELESNPYAHHEYEGGYYLEKPTPTREYTWEETVEEWIARWVEAGRPNPAQDAMRNLGTVLMERASAHYGKNGFKRD
jgi:hypothetical protein